jgi:hypothetical protein
LLPLFSNSDPRDKTMDALTAGAEWYRATGKIVE